MRFATYKLTKDSDIEWLGPIPSHWELVRGRFLMLLNPPSPQLRSLKSDDEVSFIPMEAVSVDGKLDLAQSRILSDLTAGYTEFQDGDVIVAKITPCFENGKTALAQNLSNGAAYGTTELHVLRAGTTLNPRFLFYVVISDTFRKMGEAEMYGAGGQKRIPMQYIANYKFPVPTLDEQDAIASFLDNELCRIGILIEKKLELIERLKEKRTALISRVVTRGLPPAAARAAGLNDCPSMKDSGIEWLGQIPEHWEVKRLKYTLRENLKYGANETSELTDPDLPRYVRITDIDEDGMLRQETFRSIQKDVARDYYLIEGDVLFARSGATAGKTFLYRSAWGQCAYAGYLIRARMDDTILNPHFLRHFTDSMPYWQWISSSIIQATIQNVNAEKYSQLILPIPPMAEQLSIVSFLDQQSKQIHHLRLKVEAAISKLQEYRTALITAAVTGKFDLSE